MFLFFSKGPFLIGTMEAFCNRQGGQADHCFRFLHALSSLRTLHLVSSFFFAGPFCPGPTACPNGGLFTTEDVFSRALSLHPLTLRKRAFSRSPLPISSSLSIREGVSGTVLFQ